jgi:hypothetical protein
MIDSKGGAFGFDCCLATSKFRVFQQPARGIPVAGDLFISAAVS